MKRKILYCFAALTIIMLLTPLTACSQSRILTDLPTGDGIEKVYISKALIKMGMQSQKENFKYDGMSGDIQGIEVYNCINSTLTSTVKSKIDEILKKYNAEIMIEAEEEGEQSTIYTLYDEKNNDKPIGMAVLECDDNEINLVILHGAFLQ